MNIKKKKQGMQDTYIRKIIDNASIYFGNGTRIRISCETVQA